MPAAVGTARYTRRDSGFFVRDGFNRADSATALGRAETGQAWSALSGTWGVSAGRAYSASDGGTEVAALDAGISDAVLGCTISGTLVDGSNFRLPTLLLRGTDVSNYLYVDWLSGGVRLIKLVANVSTTLATASAGLLDGVQYRARVSAVGPLVTVAIDGVQKLAWTLSAADMATFSGKTRWGLRLRKSGAPATAARWDDFQVRAA